MKDTLLNRIVMFSSITVMTICSVVLWSIPRKRVHKGTETFRIVPDSVPVHEELYREVILGQDVKYPDEYSYKAVGRFTYGGNALCTATLITKTALLTAAHCVGEEGKPSAGLLHDSYVEFPGISKKFPVKRFLSFGTVIPEVRDMAVVLLDKTVKESDLPEPIPMSTVRPLFSDKLTMVGYGCTHARMYEGKHRSMNGGVRRRSVYTGRDISSNTGESSKIKLCFGDSGAPLINNRTGSIVAVASTVMFMRDPEGHLDFDKSTFTFVDNLSKNIAGIQ